MPELPEVETTKNGIAPHLVQQTIVDAVIRERRFRWPIPRNIRSILINRRIASVERRAKYLLLGFEHGTLIMHLGMSGNLRIVTPKTPVQKHDHVDLVLNNGCILRFNDPRRFGCMLWTADPPDQHFLLQPLGPEPLSVDFTGNYLFNRIRSRQAVIKNLIMDSSIVVGVGNIYASEALHAAGIRPNRKGRNVTRRECQLLVSTIQNTLKQAILQGGTTLQDFIQPNGKPGYFRIALAVYGRDGETCKICKSTIKSMVIAQRNSFYCPKCQH